MKFNKLFMLAMAGLAMTACSSDDEMGNNLSGNGVVEVRIVAPQTRVPGPATGGDANSTVKVDGPITVKLTAQSGEQEVTLDKGVTTAKFYDVQGPQQIEAWVNDGDVNGQGTTNIGELQMQVEPANIPAYGVSKDITLAGKTETNDGQTYEMYKAKVKMEIPVARLEISGITHKHATEGAKCKYSVLSIDGIYLDKVSPKAGEPFVDYSWPAKDNIELPILKDDITAPNNFLLSGAIWPADKDEVKQAYAYNFYPNANQMPIVKIYFADAIASDDTNPVSKPRYAVIKSYNGNENFQFEAGHIYRITKVELDDKNIIGDEEGNTLYGVDVTVTEAQWTVVDTTGEWVEQ